MVPLSDFRKRPVYLSDNIEHVRTVPTPNGDKPYDNYIRITVGEVKVPWNSKVVFDVLLGGREITKEDYLEGN